MTAGRGVSLVEPIAVHLGVGREEKRLGVDGRELQLLDGIEEVLDPRRRNEALCELVDLAGADGDDQEVLALSPGWRAAILCSQDEVHHQEATHVQVALDIIDVFDANRAAVLEDRDLEPELHDGQKGSPSSRACLARAELDTRFRIWANPPSGKHKKQK